MGAILGIIIATACMLGGFVAMGGKVGVIWQPWEYLIIIGIGVGTFIGANSMYVVKDTGRAIMEAMFQKYPKRDDYIAVLQIVFALFTLMKKAKSEVERHVENPHESEIFAAHPAILKNQELTDFICDYARLITMAVDPRPHEIEGLMEHDIHTRRKDSLKPYQALSTVGDALPAIGIIAAVLGIVKAMGAISQSPEILGSLIAAALVGTFAGIFMSYVLVAPLALLVKGTREKQIKLYMVVKQAYVSFLNGAAPQIAIEYGRKGISPETRPSIDQVQDAAMARPPAQVAA